MSCCHEKNVLKCVIFSTCFLDTHGHLFYESYVSQVIRLATAKEEYIRERRKIYENITLRKKTKMRSSKIFAYMRNTKILITQRKCQRAGQAEVNL